MFMKTGYSSGPIKVFVSYDRVKDQMYRKYFDDLFTGSKDIVVMPSVPIAEIGEIKTEALREKIREDALTDSTVTVVLIGADTWAYKHVDWEISASLRDARNYGRSGLLGIVLPTYPRLENDRYDPHTLPPRLNANLKGGYATLNNWVYDAAIVAQWIKEADETRQKMVPDNTYPAFTENLKGSKWK
jgi:hypothetical protein